MEKKKSWMDLLNPFTWLAALFGPILRFLGLVPPPRTDGCQNISTADVEDAEKAARETEEAIDEIVRQMSPAEVVSAYANASPEDRAAMDLAVLDTESQDWLLSLPDDDLTLLAMSTMAGCARSLDARAMKPTYAKPQPEMETPEILTIPSAEREEEWKRQQVAERFRQVQRELWLSPGVPALQPKHAAFTLH
ncbi:hypothetical protein GOL26_22675 [Sinorhizobium medicae]|nr:hypothetical protein [Sinorhizobium medicae]MDX0997700.1 hypothetical protein [Sinorhizobium medicae]MDX1181523.1 hypothetical protein [Sinorhizobium medicae]